MDEMQNIGLTVAYAMLVFFWALVMRLAWRDKSERMVVRVAAVVFTTVAVGLAIQSIQWIARDAW